MATGGDVRFAAAGVAVLSNRAIAQIGGEDRFTFLQGLISNDVQKAVTGHAIYAALLTAQGRFLHDFFVVPIAGALLLDGEATRTPGLVERLRPYRLRSRVNIGEAGDWRVLAWWGGGPQVLSTEPLLPFYGGVAFADPRLASAGGRAVVPSAHADAALLAVGRPVCGEAAYDYHRLCNGLPDGNWDLVPEKALLMESSFDELNGIAWDKGCWLGQELTARMRYRGLIRKRLLPARVRGPLPAPGSPVLATDGAVAGEVKSGRGDRVMVLLRLDILAAEVPGAVVLTAGASTLEPEIPDWMRLPQASNRADGGAVPVER